MGILVNQISITSTPKKKIKILSGGEKARVNLGKILLQRTNILFLDEPTNHLDYESVEALIAAIKQYEGAVLTVAHDEQFLQEVATKLIVFDDDEVFFWNGDYADFLAKRGFKSEIEEGKSREISKTDSAEKLGYTEKKELQKSVRVAEREFKKVEVAIASLEKQQVDNREKVHVALQQGNRLKLETLGIEAEKIQEKISREFTRWEALGVEVEIARERLADA